MKKKMVKIKDIAQIIESFAPPIHLKDGMYDNIGLIYGHLDNEVTGVLITLDLTPEIVLEAVNKNCNLIIEHHPTIFNPIQKIDTCSSMGKIIDLCAKKDISIYAAHSNVDFAPGGLNDKFAELLGCDFSMKLDSEDPLSPRIGTLKKPKLLKELASEISRSFNDNTVFFTGEPHKLIKRIACINGAGANDVVIDKVFNCGVDAFVSSEFKHHQLRLANDSNYAIISLSHFSSEIHFLNLIYDKLMENGVQSPVYMSAKCNSPIQGVHK
ncbi:MAG TPA: Nif3-like dinuclear metal center hexameric protein [Clostridia bacterium]|jgi:dinuclear metal center YbgI/SA1388 family protein|nr:Nif3-like dinuclear metal center hexameric protein [Clostridia bacterium]